MQPPYRIEDTDNDMRLKDKLRRILSDVYQKFTSVDSVMSLLERFIRPHDHSSSITGGTLDWDTVWDDPVHSHESNAEGGTLDHGLALTGLSDDDHTQYVLANGTRDISYSSGNFQIGDTDNYSMFESDGTLQFVGEATVFNDVIIGISNAKIPASNTPDWTAFTTNTAAYTFDVDDYIDINPSEMLHGWKEGSDIELHLHWATNGEETTDTSVQWRVFWTWGDMGEAFSAESSDSVETAIPSGTADRTHMYSSFGTTSGTGFKIGSIGLLRLVRIASTTREPAADPFALNIGVHYEIDTIGSRDRTTK